MRVYTQALVVCGCVKGARHVSAPCMYSSWYVVMPARAAGDGGAMRVGESPREVAPRESCERTELYRIALSCARVSVRETERMRDSPFRTRENSLRWRRRLQGGRGSSEGFRVCRVIKAQTRGFRWCPVHRRCTVDRSQGIKLYMTYFSMHNAHTNAQRTASFLYETAADSCSHGPKAAAIGASRARG